MKTTRAAGRRIVAPIANLHAESRMHTSGNGRRSRLGAWRDEGLPSEIWLSFLPAVRHFPR